MKHLRRFNEDITEDEIEIIETCKEILYPLSDNGIEVKFHTNGLKYYNAFELHISSDWENNDDDTQDYPEITFRGINVDLFKKDLIVVNNYINRNNFEINSSYSFIVIQNTLSGGIIEISSIEEIFNHNNVVTIVLYYKKIKSN